MKPDSPRVPLIGTAVLLVVAGMQACVENWAVALIGDAAPLTWQPANMDKGATMAPTLRSTKSTVGIRSAAASQYACSPIRRTTWQAIRESAVRLLYLDEAGLCGSPARHNVVYLTKSGRIIRADVA